MKIKKLNTILLMICSVVMACNTEPDSKAIKQEVLNIHDKLMMDGEKVVKNKMKLDSVLMSGKRRSSEDAAKVADLINRLNKADEDMMDWMHFFKDDFKGKNEQEDLDYYKTEMIKIRAVEDSYIKIIRESDSVLKIYKIIPAEKMDMSNHKH